MPSPFSSVPQLAQLIDCIVNVVCHVSAVSPRVERKQGVSMLLQEEENSPPMEKEKEVRREQPSRGEREERRGERVEFYFGGNDVSADRGFAPTTQPKQQGVNAL